ncbi:hypothetical protein J3R82DRAFT_3558 [Butyriboletus roseoflavus]|nr:hypothetical protein J3R82DRAFT_3558 [Butyriboletus roseoflavus]
MHTLAQGDAAICRQSSRSGTSADASKSERARARPCVISLQLLTVDAVLWLDYWEAAGMFTQGVLILCVNCVRGRIPDSHNSGGGFCLQQTSDSRQMSIVDWESVTHYYLHPDDHASCNSDWLCSRNWESSCFTTGKGCLRQGKKEDRKSLIDRLWTSRLTISTPRTTTYPQQNLLHQTSTHTSDAATLNRRARESSTQTRAVG